VSGAPRSWTRAGFAVEWHDELDSTNAELLRRSAAGAPDRLVVVASHQTAGRGRLDRRWEAPRGSSLLVSVLLHGASTPPHDHLVVLAVAAALADAVEHRARIPVALKWPNDLVVGDRKLAGVLAERAGDALVVGAGCNVRWERFPADLADTATACNLERDSGITPADLLDPFLDRLDRLLREPDAAAAEYRARLTTLGRRVRVETADGAVVGDAVALDDDGALVVDDGGIRHRVVVGDVTHLRPA
jgi:BirA family biotin operon repressor/biotin-[acetyl-CoA-carboxylase] ligase